MTTTPASEPIEARCDHCKQTRPLFLYQPTHNAHFGFATCRWCARDKQPLLCVRCWGAERELEENDPFLNEEAETMHQICEQNARVEERRKARAAADMATVEGIVAATEQAAQ